MILSWSPPRYSLALLFLVNLGTLRYGVCAFIPRPLALATVDGGEAKHQTSRRSHLRPMKRGDSTVASVLNETTVETTGFFLNNQARDAAAAPTPPDTAGATVRNVAPVALIMGAVLAVSAATAAASMDTGSTVDLMDGVGSTVQQFLAQPQVVIQNGIDGIQSMGPLGIVYFALCFVVVDVLSIPATPLVLAAGTLFGLPQGAAVVLLSGTMSACIAFWIGQTLLRSWVQENVLTGNPKAARFDAAIGKEGFKVLFVLRLAPIFPLSAINYVYGASSIDFVSYFWGTLLGFAPSTLVYVYMGMVGQELAFGETNGQPWYVYAVGLTAVLALLQLITNVASGVVASIEQDDDQTSGTR